MEALPTLESPAGLFASWGTDPLVSQQSGADMEALSMVRATKWPLTYVGSLVDGQVTLLNKALPTFVGLLCCVELLVFHQSRFLAEGFATLLATIGVWRW